MLSLCAVLERMGGCEFVWGVVYACPHGCRVQGISHTHAHTHLSKHFDDGETPAGKCSKAVALQRHCKKDATTCHAHTHTYTHIHTHTHTHVQQHEKARCHEVPQRHACMHDSAGQREKMPQRVTRQRQLLLSSMRARMSPHGAPRIHPCTHAHWTA